MHRDALIIVHPHYGCTSSARMPFSKGMRRLKEGQEWALKDPIAERIIREHNGRDSVYRLEAARAQQRREIVFMVDHDCFMMYKWDELVTLRRFMSQNMAGRVVDEVEEIKNGLTAWFSQAFGEGHLLDIYHKNVGPYLRRNFDFPVNMRITLIGEYLHACVSDVRHSLSVMSFSNVYADEDKCVA